MKKTFQFSFVLLAMMLLASCSGGGSDSGLSDNSAGTETVFVRMNARSNSDIASVKVYVEVPDGDEIETGLFSSEEPVSICVPPGPDRVFHVSAYDKEGAKIYTWKSGKLEIEIKKEVTIPINTWTPFSPPANIKATAGDGKVSLSWDKVTEAVSYKLYWNKTGNVSKSDSAVNIAGKTSYISENLENGIPYYYAVTSVDSEGDESRESAEFSATPSACAEGADKDGDGYCSDADCDDDDDLVHPGTEKRCDDAKDNDCDGKSDSDDPDCQCTDCPPTTWYKDSDGDGYPDGEPSQTPDEGYRELSELKDTEWDCDDGDVVVYPGAEEICDGKDNDCDRSTPSDPGCKKWYKDSDGDGYSDETPPKISDVQPDDDHFESSELKDISGDCNDDDAEVNPDAAEVCGNGKDEDCKDGDLSCDDVDNDGDGVTENQGDCNDNDAEVNPDAAEVCGNGKDDDCKDGSLSCDDVDNDGDNVTENQGDCNDNDAEVNPNAVEVCGNGKDEDCKDGDLSCDDVDNDADRFTENQGDCNDNDAEVNPNAVEVCGNGKNDDCKDGDLSCDDVDNDGDSVTENQGDCDDNDAEVNPNAVEVCGNGKNDDCKDGDLSCDDVDNDGDSVTENQGDCDDNDAEVNPNAVEVCGNGKDDGCKDGDLSCDDVDNDGDRYTENQGDCDDSDASVYPGAKEICDDGKNNDCDSKTVLCECTDADQDGHFAIAETCPDGDDCNDSDIAVYPGAEEKCNDGKDNDCNSETVLCECTDADQDGHYAIAETCPDGDDCNDSNKLAYPGAPEIAGDDIDQDCDGNDPPVANNPPVADAGEDQIVYMGNRITLDGSGSYEQDEDMLIYKWSFTSKPEGSEAQLSSDSVDKPTFSADAVGDYVVQLIVNDGKVDSSPDSMTVTVAAGNSPPVANAGEDQTVFLTDAITSVSLDGSRSSDADGNPLTYQWSFTSQPEGSESVIYTSGDSAKPYFMVNVIGTYEVQLVVNDGKVDSEPDSVTITVERKVYFPDVNLRSAVSKALEALGISSPEDGYFLESDLLKLTSLEAIGKGIENITGLEYCKNLTSLNLWGDPNKLRITDITPLKGLTNLTKLQLNVNLISDITPLAGLINLRELGLFGNQISDITPLTGLINLTNLLLYDNKIEDIKPLVDNSGIGEGDVVNLYDVPPPGGTGTGNPLNPTSCDYILQLQRRRGVTVYRNCSTTF